MSRIIFLVLAISSVLIYADQLTYQVQFTGSTCTICGVTNFESISSGGSGYAYFEDPLPSNAVLNQIQVSTTAMYWCGDNIQLGFSTNYQNTANATGTYNCVCGQCPTAVSGMSPYYSNGFPNYKYGLYNILSVYNNGFSGSVGVAIITLTMTYNGGGGQYTNTSVTIPYTGCGFCNLCGSESYSLSNGGADCGEGLWDMGMRWFQDPVPAGGMVVQITVVTTNIFWCESPSQANFTVGGTFVGTSDQMDHAECMCNTCPGAQYISSKMFTSGFPGYMYGSANPIQVGAMSGIVGVGSVELIITYESSSSTTTTM